MTAHLFIVDERTLRLHLHYGFAGTGAVGSNHFRPSMAADVARVRTGDEIFFYVKKHGFVGCWEASGPPFLSDPPAHEDEFGIGLPYRVPIRPAQVFPGYLPEADALDILPERAVDVLWTLIYRKLKGLRGCTAILPHEADLLRDMLRVNVGAPLEGERVLCDATMEFVLDERFASPKLGTVTALEPRFDVMQQARDANRRSEDLLELAVVSDLSTGGPLADLLELDPDALAFFGNQVYAGVGMQAMDVVVLQNGTWTILELKWAHAYPDLARQMGKYSQHLKRRLPNGDGLVIRWVPVTLRPQRTGPKILRARQDLQARSIEAGDELTAVEWNIHDGEITYTRQ